MTNPKSYAAGLKRYSAPSFSPSPFGQVAGSALGTFAQGLQAAMLKDPALWEKIKNQFGTTPANQQSVIPLNSGSAAQTFPVTQSQVTQTPLA